MDTSIYGPLPPFVVFLAMGLLCVFALLCLLLLPPHQLHPRPHLLTFSVVFTLIFLSAGGVLSSRALYGDGSWTRRLWAVDSLFIICDSVYAISGMIHKSPKLIGIYQVAERIWYPIASFFMAVELLFLCLSFSLRRWPQIGAVAIHSFSNALWCWNYPRLFWSCISCFSIILLIHGFEVAFWTVYLLLFIGCVIFEQVHKRRQVLAASPIPIEPLAPRQHQVRRVTRKICLVGPSGVGKTWLINNYFPYDIPYEEPTLEDTYSVSIPLNGGVTKWHILDTGDPERYPHFVSDWIESGDACIIPLTNSESLDRIKRMDLGLLKKKQVLLLGMRKGNGQVEDLEARSFAFQHGWDYRHRHDGDPFEHVARVYYSR